LDHKLVSSVSGVVEHVNKLVVVKPLRSRYQADVGDVVVGRITDVCVGLALVGGLCIDCH
jgi:exosome complex component RRP4